MKKWATLCHSLSRFIVSSLNSLSISFSIFLFSYWINWKKRSVRIGSLNLMKLVLLAQFVSGNLQFSRIKHRRFLKFKTRTLLKQLHFIQKHKIWLDPDTNSSWTDRLKQEKPNKNRSSCDFISTCESTDSLNPPSSCIILWRVLGNFFRVLFRSCFIPQRLLGIGIKGTIGDSFGIFNRSSSGFHNYTPNRFMWLSFEISEIDPFRMMNKICNNQIINDVGS